MMVLNDLSLSGALKTEEVKAMLEDQLRVHLPEGSFTVIVRSYSSDVRSRESNKVNYSTIILLKQEGQKAALEKRASIEAAGFQVLDNGKIQRN